MAPRVLAFVAGASVAASVKIADMDDGAAFEKCVKIEDIQTKTVDDDITLVDRESGGCCPSGSVPGVKHTTNYQGPQIICGFKADGTVAISTGSSNGEKTCTYNSCFVFKQGVTCADDSKQRLNGCCAAPADCAGNACGFDETCKNYANTFNNVYGEKTEYCTIYDKDYGTKGWAGTSGKDDDIADGKLVTENLYTYTRCGSGGSSGGSSGSSGATQTGVSALGMIVVAGLTMA